MHEFMLQDIGCVQHMEHVITGTEELDDWFWIDEAWFHLDVYIISQNCRMLYDLLPQDLISCLHYCQRNFRWSGTRRLALNGRSAVTC